MIVNRIQAATAVAIGIGAAKLAVLGVTKLYEYVSSKMAK